MAFVRPGEAFLVCAGGVLRLPLGSTMRWPVALLSQSDVCHVAVRSRSPGMTAIVNAVVNPPSAKTFTLEATARPSLSFGCLKRSIK